MILRLEKPADVERAVVLASWLNRPSVERVEMSLPWMTEQEQERAARAFVRLFNDCGCYVGAPVFLVVLAAAVHRLLADAAFSWPGLGASVLIAGAAAMAAKFLALAWSRRQLVVRLRNLTPAHEAVSLGKQRKE